MKTHVRLSLSSVWYRHRAATLGSDRAEPEREFTDISGWLYDFLRLSSGGSQQSSMNLRFMKQEGKTVPKIGMISRSIFCLMSWERPSLVSERDRHLHVTKLLQSSPVRWDREEAITSHSVVSRHLWEAPRCVSCVHRIQAAPSGPSMALLGTKWTPTCPVGCLLPQSRPYSSWTPHYWSWVWVPPNTTVLMEQLFIILFFFVCPPTLSTLCRNETNSKGRTSRPQKLSSQRLTNALIKLGSGKCLFSISGS